MGVIEVQLMAQNSITFIARMNQTSRAVIREYLEKNYKKIRPFMEKSNVWRRESKKSKGPGGVRNPKSL